MKCPSCPDTTLVMTDRQGVEIDYCPACRGIWLDRGELDKLLDRAGTAATAPAVAQTAAPVQRAHYRPDFEDSDFRDGRHTKRHYKKSWLSEIFD
ncbi:MAG: zf-TFIIB domain-containing protein [Rhodoferax sp.]|nr:zf-TFIIB domain-containing protein [Rhodoferax sp.]